MQRRTADLIVGSAIALVIVVGLIGTWQAWQTSQQASSGMMMNGMMTTSMYTGPSPIWILFGTVAIVAIIGVGYVVVRQGATQQTAPRFDRESSETTAPVERSHPGNGTPTDGMTDGARPVDGTPTGAETGDRTTTGTETATTGGTGDGGGPESATGEQDSTGSEPSTNGTESSGERSRPPILDVLPEDERRILEPVIESPGLTQIALRDRADFSKSKVSQTVSDLEKRGLLSRERQGRTYRIYPSDDLVDQG